MMRAAQGNTQGFLQLLRQLRHSWRGKSIHLWVDGAPWHKGSLVHKYLATHPNLRLEYMPPYPPRLNPQERIEHQVRHERTNNHWFPSLDETWKAIRDTSRRWSVDKVQRLCNII